MSYTEKQTAVLEVDYTGFDGYPAKAWWVESSQDPGFWALEGIEFGAINSEQLGWQLEILQALKTHLDQN